MGIVDHNKTWQFHVAAPQDACRRAFEDAVTRKPGLKIRAVNWSLRRDRLIAQPGAAPAEASIATYTGRGGIATGLTLVMGRRAQNTEQGAIGSELAFVADQAPAADGRTTCSMWMNKIGTTFGFTNDAGYFRSYMADVEKNLRQLDPDLIVRKN